MRKERENEEIVGGNGHEFKFAGTFGAAEALSLQGRDVTIVLSDLQNGDLNVSDIKNTLVAYITYKDGKEIEEAERDSTAKEFIELFGLQDSAALCRVLICYSILGDLKKKQLIAETTVETILDKLSLSRSTILRRLGSSWVVRLASFIALVCMISSGTSALTLWALA